MNAIIQAAPLLARGALTTVGLWASTAIISMGLGWLCGIARSDKLRPRLLAPALDTITFVLRGVPFYVQLLIAYFVLPHVLGISVPACVAAIGSLGLCSAAYTSQIVRASINALSIGQWEAAQVLGYSTAQTLRYIIVPQALRTSVPPLLSEVDQLLKSTSIISSIGVLELTRAAGNIIARTMDPLPIYLTIAAIYLACSALITRLAARLEQRMRI